MKVDEMRRIAIGAVRSELRRNGKNPNDVSNIVVHDTLDHIARTEPGLIASQWYSNASKYQWRMFWIDWNADRRWNPNATRQRTAASK